MPGPHPKHPHPHTHQRAPASACTRRMVDGQVPEPAALCRPAPCPQPPAPAALPPCCRRAQVAAVQAGWQALVQDPGLRGSFLSTPIRQLVKRGTGFTQKQAQ